MSNPYYSHSSAAPVTQTRGVSATMRSEFDSIAAGFDAISLAVLAGADIWVSETTYAAGDVVYSPIDYQDYRRKTAGAGATDPSVDTTNWARVDFGIETLFRSARTSNTILGQSDRATLIDVTSGTFSQTLTAAATLGSGWYCYIYCSGTGVVTLDPNGAELVNGAATLALATGKFAILQCDGTGFNAVVLDFSVGDHSVVVTTGNGHGSTNTKIRRFTTTLSSSGTAITYADSVTLGASFTINSPGLYQISYSDNYSASIQAHGVSLNSAQLTTGITTITAANRLAETYSIGAGISNSLTITARLATGDVIRPHTVGLQNGASVDDTYFSIRKVGA